MNFSNSEIINALTVIKGTCEQYEDCNVCPLSKKEEAVCMINNIYSPSKWEIDYESFANWRAFR